MSKTSATRSVCATLLVAALGLLLATPAQAGLVLDLTTVEGNLNANSVTVQPGMLAGTSTSFTVYLYAVVSGGTSLTNNALEAVTANIVGVSNGTNTTGGYVFSTGGTSGISTVSTDLNAWSLLAQNGSPNDGTLTGTASGLGGAQLGTNSWGSNTNGLNYIGVSKGTKATTAMQEGTDGFAPSTNTWAYLVATVTLTVNANDLVGSGTVDYQAQLSAAPGTLPSAIYFANGTGTVAQKLYAAGSGAAAASTANSVPFVVNYTAPVTNATLALANLTTSGTIFAGGSFNAIGTLTASGSDATNAKLTLTGTSGNLNILSGSAGTGTLTASTGSLTLSSTVNSTGTAGSYVLTYTGTSDNNVATVTNTLNLTVLEHASPTGTATVSIGSVLGGAPNVTATMTLGNASSDVNMTRGSLQVTGTTAGLSGAPIGTLLAAGSSTTLTAVINTASKSTAPGSFTVNVSDNQAYNGYQTQTDQTLTVTGTIGWASANSSTSYGTALTAAVNAGQALTGLFSQVDANHHGTGTAGTVAKILYSATLGTGTTVGMQWRQPTAAELTLAAHPLVSDVVDLTGMPAGTYVLQMSYDPTAPNLSGNDGALAAAGKLYLAYNNAGVWQNAIAGNTGFNSSMLSTASPQFHDGAWAGDTTLNDWGVDTSTDTVWAVLNHASEFAVVPEPATMAFLLLGGLAMSATALRRRSARK
jgi:hypothetical protein